MSNIWYAWQVREGRLLTMTKALHRRYGPAVRIGPNEVWFDSQEAFRAIYATGSGFEKSEFYLSTLLQNPSISWNLKLTHPDTLDLLSERDMKRYRRQRRAIRSTYHIESLEKHEPALDAAIERILAGLCTLGTDTVDLKEWMHISVVECLGAVVLRGWSSGYLTAGSDFGSSAHALMAWRRKSVAGLFPLATVLGMISRVFSRTFNKLWGIAHGTPMGFRSFFPAVQKVLLKRLGNGHLNQHPNDTTAQTPGDLLDELIGLHKTMPDEWQVIYLRRMAMTNFGAGHETMTSAMITVLATVGTRPDVQHKIFAEIKATAPPSGGRKLSFAHILRMTYTVACIKEAQRLYPVIGMSLSRTVPAGQPLALHGHIFPPGTTVGCVPAALHRNTAIFGADADTFRPERWLDTDRETRRLMDRVNLTYGGGARNCPGRHFAELVVYKLVANILDQFEVAAQVPPENAVKWYFLAFLTGARARFLPREFALG